MSIKQVISDQILVLFGRNIDTSDIKRREKAKFLGNGVNFIEPGSVSEKHSTAVVWAHGNVLNPGTSDEMATMRNLFPERFFTIDNLKVIKENADVSTYFLLSCHSGAIYNDLKRNIDDFAVGTKLIAFSSTKHTSISEMNIRRVNQLTKIYAQQNRIDPEEFFSENIVRDPQSVVFNEIITDDKGNKKLLSVKAIAPKSDDDMQDLPSYFKSGKALVCLGGRPDDPDYQALVYRIQQRLNKCADKLNEKDLQQYKNRALIDSVNRDIDYRVRDWIQNGADYHVRLKNGFNLLHIACFYNHAKAGIELLRFNQIDINQSENSGIPPLHLACRLGNVPLVKAFLEHGADPLIKDEEGLTAFHMAFENKNYIELIDLLLSYSKFDVNQERDEFGDNFLHMACREGRIDLVKLLLSKTKSNPILRNENGETPLQIACENGHLKIVDELLAHPLMDPNTMDVFGNTVLHQACKKDNLELVQKLIENSKIDANRTNKNGDTPLIIASMNQDSELTEFLLNHPKVNVNKKNKKFGEKPIVLLYQNNNLPLFKKMLTRKDSDPNSFDGGDHKPLAMVVYEEHKYNYLKALMDHPNFNFTQAIDSLGNTLLHIASNQGDLEFVSDILEHDDNMVNQTNAHGDTALHVACKKSDIFIVKELLSVNGIDTKLKNNDGLTPLDLALLTGGEKSPVARAILRNEKKYLQSNLMPG